MPGQIWTDPRLAQISTEGGIQKHIAGVQAETALKQAMLQKEAAQIAAAPQTKMADLASQRFEFNRNLLKDTLGQFGNLYAAGQRGTGGPAVTKGPKVETGPVFSPEEMTMQQNQVRDRSMQQAAGVKNRLASQFAGRGLAGNSPFVRKIGAMTENQGRIGGERAALDFSRQMATENARNMLASQELQQQVENQYQQNLLSRYGIQQQGNNQLLALLGSLMGGLSS
jgi:hypothetical protein